MDLLQRIAIDSSMPKWGCRKKCTPRLPVDQEVNKNVDNVGQQPKQSDEKEKQPEQPREKLILRIKQGGRATFIAKDVENPAPLKPFCQPPPPPSPLPELADEDDPDWKEKDAKEETSTRSKRKRKTEEDNRKKKKEIPRERPEFLFRLTQEQAAEDFRLFTGRGPSRRSLRRRPNIDVLCPGSSLPGRFTKDRYHLQMIRR